MCFFFLLNELNKLNEFNKLNELSFFKSLSQCSEDPDNEVYRD